MDRRAQATTRGPLLQLATPKTQERCPVFQEHAFLQEPGILVSTTRIELAGQTFAMRNVGSVKVVNPGVSALAVFIVIVAFLFGVGQFVAAQVGGGVVALALAALAVYWVYRGTAHRKRVLIAGGGEVIALQTHDVQFVERVRRAVADAIATR